MKEEELEIAKEKNKPWERWEEELTKVRQKKRKRKNN